MTLVREAPSLHQRILTDLEGKIVSGEWPPGFRLPFEIDLAAQYGCSRMTANKVLTHLAKVGLIERRRKSGSFVAQPAAQSAVLEIHDIEAEVRSLKLAYSYSLIRRVVRKAAIADAAHLESATRVIDLASIHFAGGRPFCLEERLINLSSVPEAEGVDFSASAPGAWLLKRVPWSAAEHQISATSSAADAARMLDIARGSACLVIERRTWSSTGPVTFVRFTYPGDRHRLVARFAPGGESASPSHLG